MADDRRRKSADAELEMYRSIIDEPTEFKNGFTWVTVVGAFFCGLLMMPGSIYLSLMTGGGIGASWVTLIIFSEVTRRAMKTLSKQELCVLLAVAGTMAGGGPIGDLIWRQFLIRSDAARDMGLIGKFPSWFAPQPTSEAILGRNLFHSDWFIPIMLMVFLSVIGTIRSYTLGYFFFRVTSDVERLPFPFASVEAPSAPFASAGAPATGCNTSKAPAGAGAGAACAKTFIAYRDKPLTSATLINRCIRLFMIICSFIDREVLPPWFHSSQIQQPAF